MVIDIYLQLWVVELASKQVTTKIDISISQKNIYVDKHALLHPEAEKQMWKVGS